VSVLVSPKHGEGGSPFQTNHHIRGIKVIGKGSKNRGFYEFTQRIAPFQWSK
jgi:hypothetical protein